MPVTSLLQLRAIFMYVCMYGQHSLYILYPSNQSMDYILQQLNTDIHTCPLPCIHTHIHTRTYKHTCLYIHIHTQTHTHKHKHTGNWSTIYNISNIIICYIQYSHHLMYNNGYYSGLKQLIKLPRYFLDTRILRLMNQINT